MISKEYIGRGSQEKVDSRQFIANFCNKLLPDKPKRMLELLGNGEGISYYTSNMDLSLMYVFERSRDKVKEFCDKYDISSFNANVSIINDCISNCTKYTNKPFDIVNLDLCTYYYEDGPLQLIKHLLNKSIISKNGLLFLCNMIDGYQIDVSRIRNKIIVEPKKIIDSIVNNTDGLIPLDKCMVYKTGTRRGSIMFVYGFKCYNIRRRLYVPN